MERRHQSPVPSTHELEHLATDYRNNGQVEKAVEIYHVLMERFEGEDMLLRAAEMQHMIGVSYKVGNYTQKSLDALGDALRRYRELKDDVHIGRAERDIGVAYQYSKNFEAALPHLKASVATLEHTNDRAELGISEVKLGHLFHEMELLDDAEQWIEKGAVTLQQADHWFYQATTWLHLADLRLSQGNLEAALHATETAEYILNEHDAAHTQQRRMAQLYYLKAAIYQAMNRESDASQARDVAATYADMLDNASRTYLHSKL